MSSSVSELASWARHADHHWSISHGKRRNGMADPRNHHGQWPPCCHHDAVTGMWLLLTTRERLVLNQDIFARLQLRVDKEATVSALFADRASPASTVLVLRTANTWAGAPARLGCVSVLPLLRNLRAQACISTSGTCCRVARERGACPSRRAQGQRTRTMSLTRVQWYLVEKCAALLHLLGSAGPGRAGRAEGSSSN